MRIEALRKLWMRLRSGGNVERTLNSDSFTDSELAVGRMILPLLDDLAAAQKVIEELTARTRALDVVLSLVPVAALVLDRQGRLLIANAAAKALFNGPAIPERIVSTAARVASTGDETASATLQKTDAGDLALRLVAADVGRESNDDDSPAVVFLVPEAKPVAIDSAALTRRFALTGAQMKVVEHLCHGLTNREIANELGLSVETVRKHVATIFDKTGVNTRSAVVALAYGARFGSAH